MKRMLKKSLAFILALTMVFGAAPLAGLVGLELPSLKDVFTEKAEAATYRGTCGGSLTWALDTETGVLEINGTGTMKNYYSSSSNAPWYNYRSSIKTITIGNNVTSIGDDAFYNCTGLTSITIPDSVTSIGNGAFYECTGLTSITIPDNVTTIGDWTFRYCTGLTNITIPDSVTSIGSGAFHNCDGLTSLTIPDSVTSIGDWAFESCDGLTSLTIPDSVTSIGGGAFYGCDGLTSVIIGNSLTSISSHAFAYCNSLTNITIPDSVTSIEYGAFERCTGLTSVTIPDSVTSIGIYAFYDCTRLTDVYYADSEADWNKITISSYNDSLINANIHFNYVTDSNVTEEPVVGDEVVKNPSTASIAYGDSIVLHVDPSKIPEGGYVEWTASNGNFSMSVSADGTTCKISPKSNGKTVFTATVYDKDGNVVSSDTQEMTAKAGLWQKIVAFFKKIFGLTKTFPEAFKGIL